ncbi:suppressor 2 [Penicillium sp. IBT 31633x]|nr:suppressor 2 [Penicillium sp. IBT 31633x]
MTSNNHDTGSSRIPDTHKEHTISLPYAHGRTSSTNATMSSPPNRKDASPEKSWQPKLGRQQSWSNEDRKHQMQGQLLEPEKGKETGFTEVHSEK